MRRICLDHQASTPVLPEVFEAMCPWFTDHFGNPLSLHGDGLRARDALATARGQFAKFLNATSSEEIIFTSGGTESANLVVKGTALARQRRGKHIVVSELEHPSVLNSVESLEAQGFTCTRVGVDGEGFVLPDAVRAALREDTILICVQHANPDLGAIQPVRQIGEIAAEHGTAFFVDATASGGWLPVDVQAFGASFVSLSPHRFHGPKGVGVLYRNARARLSAIQHGGDQEGGRRAGTENVPAIVGAGVAAEIAARDLPQRVAHAAQLQRRLWDGLSKRVELIRFTGPLLGARRLPGHVSLCVEFVEGEGLLLVLDLNGVAVASGPACVSKQQRIPPALKAIGLGEELARGNLLLTLGRENTAEEMDLAAEAIGKAVEKLRGLSPSWDDFQAGRVDSVIRPRAGAKAAARP
ncbi:MAG: cysteine desulfurase [Verrucomicrobia bacterium]|nr:cysteine desulfurase [Verrucomicrobiota bacterium]